MGKELLIRMLVSMLGEYLIKPKTAAKYAKYFIRARDYLILLFPLDTYPMPDYGDTNLSGGASKYAVPPEEVTL